MLIRGGAMDKKWIVAVVIVLVLIVAAAGVYVYTSGDDNSDNKTQYYPAGTVFKYQRTGEIKDLDTGEIVTYESTDTYLATNEIEDNNQIQILINDVKYSNGNVVQLNNESFTEFPDSLPDKVETIETLHYGEKELYVEEYVNVNGWSGISYYSYTNGIMITYAQNGTTTNDGWTESYRVTESYRMDLIDYHIAEESECAVFYMGNGSTEFGLCDLITDGTEVTVPDCSFKYENHVFKGWNTSADGKGTAYAAGSTFEATGECVTLYAQWEEPK